MQQNNINAGSLEACGITSGEIKVGAISFGQYPTGTIDIKSIQAALPASAAPLPSVYPINGSRTLSQVEIDLINRIKKMGDEVYALINDVRELHMQDVARNRGAIETGEAIKELSRLVEQGQHWRMRAVDDLQSGLMKLVRAVARPTTFA